MYLCYEGFQGHWHWHCFIGHLSLSVSDLPSVLWRCWLGCRKGIRPVKSEWWGAGMVICLQRGADLHMAQLMLLPLTVSCFSKMQIGFTFLVPVNLGSPGKWAVKWVCVCVCVCLWSALCYRKVSHPTFNDNLNSSHPIPVIFLVVVT